MDPIERLRAHQPELRKDFKVAKIGVFGSFARREDQASSGPGLPEHSPIDRIYHQGYPAKMAVRLAIIR